MVKQILTPPQSWRALGWEVAVVVVGVLIALAAQQFVDDLNWRREVTAQREALLGELRVNLKVLRYRLDQERCVERRLDEIGRAIDLHRRGLQVRVVGPVGAPRDGFGTRGTWQIAVASQALAHMSLTEKSNFSGSFGQLDQWDRVIADERETWRAFGRLDDPAAMTERDWDLVRDAWIRERQINEELMEAGRRYHQQIVDRFDLDVPKSTPPELVARKNAELCAPLLAG